MTNQPVDEKEEVTVKEAARMMGCTIAYIRTLTAGGQLPSRKLDRIVLIPYEAVAERIRRREERGW